jgi:hypothetical protein
MRLEVLTTAIQQARGAMFRRLPEDVVLAFPYPAPSRRLFHTFFCPPLRIVALDEGGQPIYDRVITAWQFVQLPPTRLILEMHPRANHSALLEEISQQGVEAWLKRHNVDGVRLPQAGGLREGVSLEGLVFGLLASALADLRTIRDTRGVYDGQEIDVPTLKERIPVWRRGQILASAGFILDLLPDSHWSIPLGAISLSRKLISAESGAYVEELFAASEAGIPWENDFACTCLRCGSPHCSWRYVLGPFEGLRAEWAWRLGRPENAVSLCKRCAYELGFNRRPELQLDMVWGLWGPRFEALLRWYRALQAKSLPDHWSRLEQPLWPLEYGGPTWARGSGSLAHCRPQPAEGVARSRKHREALARALSGSSLSSPGRAASSPLSKMLHIT